MMLAVEPHVGALPIKFGMIPSEVASVAGPATSVLPGSLHGIAEVRPNLVIGYTDVNTVYEINCHPGISLMYKGVDLFDIDNTIQFLRQYDNSPILWVGFVIFLELGIQLSGFHDSDVSQKAISLIMNESILEYSDDFVPFEG